MTYHLPPIKGWPGRLRLVALVLRARENDCHVRVVSALLALLLDATRSASLQFTPQQRDIYSCCTPAKHFTKHIYMQGNVLAQYYIILLRLMIPSIIAFFVDYKCNFKCGHCSIGSCPDISSPMSREVFDAFFAQIGNLPSVKVLTFTGGEATPRLPFLSSWKESGAEKKRG